MNNRKKVKAQAPKKKSTTRLQSLAVGNPEDGYTFPEEAGTAGQLMMLDDAGELVWGEYSGESIQRRVYCGSEPFINGDSRIKGIVFPAFDDASYSISLTIRYDGKGQAQFYNAMVTDKYPTSFEILTDRPVKVGLGENYWLEWTVTEND